MVLFCQLAVGGLYQTGGRMDGEIKQGECGRAFSFGGGCIHVGVVGNIVATVFEQATTMEIVMFLSCFCQWSGQNLRSCSVSISGFKKGRPFRFRPLPFKVVYCGAIVNRD